MFWMWKKIYDDTVWFYDILKNQMRRFFRLTSIWGTHNHLHMLEVDNDITVDVIQQSRKRADCGLATDIRMEIEYIFLEILSFENMWKIVMKSQKFGHIFGAT